MKTNLFRVSDPLPLRGRPPQEGDTLALPLLRGRAAAMRRQGVAHSGLFAVLLTLFLTACTAGPNYHRPVVRIPATFRTTAPVPEPEAASLADEKWFEVFKDPVLQNLIRAALEQNYDLRIAVANVEAERANLGITRSNQYPNIANGANVDISRLSRNGSLALPPTFVRDQERNWGEASLNLLSFEVDIWGRLRRATEAARANLLAADENRKAVITTLVSDVATNYFTLRELDYELDIAQRTLGTRQESLRLIQTRQGGGIATLLDLRQGEQLVYSASASIPELRERIERTENQISLLLGQNPDAIDRGRGLTEQGLPEVPAGMTSALLERRPDIRAAEENLVAANANIGVAKAAYFPQISLSGFLGGQSTQLASLFNGPNTAWSFVPQITQPIFTGGRLRSGVRLAEAQHQAALAQYEKSIRTAFSEVSDALIAHERLRESRAEQENLVTSLQDRTRLAYVRYQGGVDTLLNALDADRDLFQAELTLSQTRLNELLSVVQLYKALGGGWE
jgi:outer membrane protein, multidrug efflux system